MRSPVLAGCTTWPFKLSSFARSVVSASFSIGRLAYGCRASPARCVDPLGHLTRKLDTVNRHPPALQTFVRTMAKGRKRKDPEPETHLDNQQEKALEDASGAKHSTGLHVNPDRIRELRGGEIKPGPVIYW